jgi:hypothetical protein
MPKTADWSGMNAMSASLLKRRTGAGVEEWNRRVRQSDADTDQATLRRWLEDQGVRGYAQQLLVFERFGYPDYLLASADQLVDAQYADRPTLRPILDRILSAAPGFEGVTVQARKGYVTLVTPRRAFALIRVATGRRVDLGLRLDAQRARGRLRPAGSLPQ